MAPSYTGTKEDIVYGYFHELIKQDAAWAAMTLYLAISIVLTIITIRTKAWFMFTVVLTGFFEMAGFAARGSFISNPVYIAYLLMQCFLIISPVLLAIVEYITVGRLIQMSKAGKGSRLAKWMGFLYTLSDLFCLVLQGAGGGAIAQKDPKAQELGRKLLLAGLFLQLCFFTSFLILTARVHMNPAFGFKGWKKMQPLFFCLYSTIVLMFIRNIFRVAEFIQGFYGYLATHEVYFYVFDFIPIFCCFLFFTFFHYGFYLNTKEESLEQEEGERKSGNAIAPIEHV